jgi:hypothetical protein
VAVTGQGLEQWWSELVEADRQHMLNAWQGRPLDQVTRTILDRVPGLPRIRGSFAGRELEEYMPPAVKEFIARKRAETGWQPGQ